jgi:multidrug efflux system membrane fusion protein
MKSTTRRLLWGAGIIIMVSAAGFTLATNVLLGGAKADVSASAPAQQQALPVSVAVVEPREVTTWDEFSGRLEAVDRVEVRSRVAGAIESVHFREGALVKKGDLLVTIDQEPYRATVAQAEAQVAAAQARVELAKLEFERAQKLVQTRTASQSNLDQRLSAYHEAEANLQSGQAALQTARLDLGYTEVRAPIAGRVGKLEITSGNLVAAGSGSPVLTRLVSVDPIYASFNASEDIVTRALAKLPASGDGALAVDQIPVEIGTVGDDGTPIRGRLQLIDNEVDTASGTVRVRAVFDNPDGRLLPGQFVRVRMGEPKPQPELVISERAVGTDQDKKYVFVVDTDNKVAYRQVTLGVSVEGLRIVESGLNAGDRIVVNGLQRVRPGAVVNPQLVAMKPLQQALASTNSVER